LGSDSVLHEIALRTTVRDRQGPKYRTYRPVGSIASVWSERRKKRKWCEIVCDLAAPYKRDGVGERLKQNLGWTDQQWDAAVGAWTADLWEEWFEASRQMAPQDKPFGDLWAKIVGVAGWSDALGNDPHNDVPLHDTVLWSPADRRGLFVIAQDTLSSDDVEAKKGDDEPAETAKSGVITPRLKVDWETRLGLSGGTLAEIRNPGRECHPRFNYPVAEGLFESATIAVPT
jgi:hypothetical protein